jgi:hypothetical protein
MRTLTGFLYYPDSLEEADGLTYFLARSEEENVKLLGVMSPETGANRLSEFREGTGIAGDSGATTHLYPLTPENAALLRERLPWLRPQPLGLRTTAGFGDRLGQATPGHVRAVERVNAQGIKIAPVFAQQSVRENARTRRTPQQVMSGSTTPRKMLLGKRWPRRSVICPGTGCAARRKKCTAVTSTRHFKSKISPWHLRRKSCCAP